jgi:tetratricopeptide (TPR) repeat protein
VTLSTQSTFDSVLGACAEAVLPNVPAANASPSSVVQLIREASKGCRVLLVLDSVWTSKIVTQTQREFGDIWTLLITSRSGPSPSFLNVFAVSLTSWEENPELVIEFMLTESRDVNLSPPTSTERELILAIAKRCGFVPLCMKVAARRKRVSTWEALMDDEFFQSDIGPVKDHPGLETLKTVFDVIAWSINALDEHLKSYYLQLVVLNNGEHIPIEVLQHFWNQKELALQEMLSELSNLSLLHFDEVSSTVSVHDLHLECIWKALHRLNVSPEKHFQKLLESWGMQVGYDDQISEVAFKFPKVTPHASGHLGSNLPRYMYCAGAKNAASLVSGYPPFLARCIEMGGAFYSIDTNAVWVCTEFLNFCRQSNRIPTSTLAIPLLRLSAVHKMFGRFIQCKKILEEAITYPLDVLPEPIAMMIKLDLAEANAMCGHDLEAVAQFDKLKPHLTGDYAPYLSVYALSVYAKCLEKIGCIQEAHELLGNLNNDPISQLDSVNPPSAEGKLNEALTILQKVPPSQKFNIDLMISYLQGKLLGLQAKTKEAAKCLADALEKSKHRLGAFHPITLALRYELAVVKIDEVGTHEALKEIEDVVEGLRISLGENSDQIVIAQLTKAFCLWDQGNLIGAGNILNTLLDQHKRLVGATGPETMIIQDALIYLRLGFSVRRKLGGWTFTEPTGSPMAILQALVFLRLVFLVRRNRGDWTFTKSTGGNDSQSPTVPPTLEAGMHNLAQDAGDRIFIQDLDLAGNTASRAPQAELLTEIKQLLRLSAAPSQSEPQASSSEERRTNDSRSRPSVNTAILQYEEEVTKHAIRESLLDQEQERIKDFANNPPIRLPLEESSDIVPLYDSADDDEEEE